MLTGVSTPYLTPHASISLEAIAKGVSSGLCGPAVKASFCVMEPFYLGIKVVPLQVRKYV
jgi:hypothetical protein